MHRSPAAPAQPSSVVATWKPWVTVVAAAAATALLVAAASMVADDVPDAVAHGLSHLAAALPIGFLLFAALRRWPPARTTRPGRLGRRLVVVGLAGVLIGQLLEVAGARVDEPAALAIESVAHTAGQIFTILSMPVLLVGMLASLLAGAREGDVPWWLLMVIGIAAVALFAFLMVGAP